MRFLFSTGSLHTYGIDRCFAIAAQSGCDGIELMVDQRWDTRQPAYLRELSRRFHLPIVAIHAPFSMAPGWPVGQPAQIAQSVALAEAIGAEVVVHHLPLRLGYAAVSAGARRFFFPLPGWNMEEGYRRWLLGDGYRRLQASTAVRLCIENMPARRVGRRRLNLHHWNSTEAIMRFDAITMDTTHLGTWALDAAAVYAAWGSRVQHIHLSNFQAGREHRRPEQGELRLDRLLALLVATGYPHNVTLELHPDALDAGQADGHIVDLLHTSVDACRRWAAGAPAQAVAA